MPFPVFRIVEHQCAVLASWLQLKAEVGGSPRLRLLPFQISFRESLIMPVCIFVIAIRYQMCEQFEFQWYVIRPFFGARFVRGQWGVLTKQPSLEQLIVDLLQIKSIVACARHFEFVFLCLHARLV